MARIYSNSPLLLAAALAALAAWGCASSPPSFRPFSDRAVAWHEGDDVHLEKPPAPTDLGEEKIALFVRDFFTREADRLLSLEKPQPAKDVNALDEVPCSTWFCPRNHLFPLTPAEVAAGPPGAVPPELPLTISSGKAQGVAPGFVVRDSAGRKYMVKLDPVGHPGLASGAESISTRLFHAAGYHAPGAFPFDVARQDLRIRADARFQLSGAAERPFTPQRLEVLLRGAAEVSPGVYRAVAVPWIPGQVLGPFDMYGRRPDDPNDRIPHQNRRSLRASYVLIAWLNIEDASALNTLDSYVEEDGKRFVRHYFIDFGDSLGSASVRKKSVFHGREYILELDRILLAGFSFGLYRRPWQADARLWAAEDGGPPDGGWYHPTDDWRPDEFRTGRKNPAHLRMTAADAYWGAKIVTSFTDAQIREVVAVAQYSPETAAYIETGLRIRRDRIAVRYLLTMTAVENPRLDADGRSLCFDDLAITRGYARAREVSYHWVVRDEQGQEQHRRTALASGTTTCLSLGAIRGADYQVVSIESEVAGKRALPSHVHLSSNSRDPAGRVEVVGIERGPPDPRRGEGLDGRAPAPSNGGVKALALSPLRAAAFVVLTPIDRLTGFIERHEIADHLYEASTSDDRLVGVRPIGRYESGFGLAAGARLFDRRSLGPGSLLGASLQVGGASVEGSLTLEPPGATGWRLRLGYDRHDDALFGGIGGASRDELQAQGLDVVRYGFDRATAELGLRRALWRGLSAELSAGLDNRRYRGAPATDRESAIEAIYCPPPAGPGCVVDSTLVPGFESGVQLFRAGLGFSLDTRPHPRYGSGIRSALFTGLARGLAGDDTQLWSARARLGGIAAFGNHTLGLHLQAGLVEPIGDRVIPFEELLSPTGSAGVRGLSRGRLRGRSEAVATLEYRWLLAAWLDAILFVDRGSVYGPLWEDFSPGQAYTSFGLALVTFSLDDVAYWRSAPQLGVELALSPDGGLRATFRLHAW